MNKKLLSSILLFSTLSSFAQKGFENKKPQSSGVPLQQSFETISAKGSKADPKAKLAFTPSQISKKIIKDEETGAVVYIDHPLYTKNIKNARINSSETSRSFLNSLKTDLKINNPGEEFRLIDDQTDELGLRHIKLEQTFKNVPIYGGESVVHTNKNGVAEFLMGKVFPSPNLNVVPNISATAAIELSLKDMGKTSIVQKTG